jgi:hypothetical protein
LAENVGETSSTRTGKAVDCIDTGRTVLARVGTTFIDIRLTQNGRVTSSTSAAESIHSIHTGRSILAWVGRTFVDIDFTPSSSKASRATKKPKRNVNEPKRSEKNETLPRASVEIE